MLFIKTLFYVRKDKIDKLGNVPIYLRLTKDSERVEFSVKSKVKLADWDSEKQKCKGSAQAKINHKIETIKSGVNNIENKYLLNEEEPDLAFIKDCIVGKKEKKKTLEHWLVYLDRVELLIGKDYAEATYKKYKTTFNHFRDFLQEVKKVNDINYQELDVAMVSDFKDYLKTKKGLSHNTTIKYMKNFKVVADDAKRRKWLKHDPFESLKMKYRPIEISYLKNDELRLIEQKKFEIERLERVRNIFLFACYTGLSFVDIFSLKPNHIGSQGGVLLIDKRRVKTDISSLIPLSEKALDILRTYRYDLIADDEYIFPKISNQKYNSYLKEIADLCGINKALSSHDARRTFATTIALEQGVSIESVSRMLGHNGTASTKKYAKTTNEKIIAESRRAGIIS